MNTNILTIQEIKEFVTEVLLNKTNKLSKISDNSGLNGISFGLAKGLQKAYKDIALIESHLFPEYAYSENLDIIAKRQGISSRFGASKSSTYLRIVADPGTIYLKNTNIFKASNGISFELEADLTVGSFGYEYVKIRSLDSGSKTNVEPLTINRVQPQPIGHKYCINEYLTTGGRDIEQDDVFRKRIQEAPNYTASSTLAKLSQVFMKINNDVLKVLYGGIDNTGKIILNIVTQNGIDLTSTEIDDILAQGQEYFSLTEQKLFGNQSSGIILQNITYQPIDIDFRVELFNNVNPDDIRKDIQIQISKYFDFRFWDYTKKVEWDDLLQIIKSTTGVKYVLDSYFIPGYDFYVDRGKLPRLRGFIMRSLDGNIIQNVSGTLNPVYYSNDMNINFQTTVLSTI